MQYGQHCFADNTVGRYGKRPDSECNMKCNKDGSRICGGGWRNSVVKLIVKAKPIVSYYGETHIGCFRDNGNRDLPKRLPAIHGNPKDCFRKAMEAGF